MKQWEGGLLDGAALEGKSLWHRCCIVGLEAEMKTTFCK